MWARLWNRCLFLLLRRRRFDRELREELDFHRAMLETDRLRDGVAPAEAAALARRQLGNTLVAREEAHVPWRSALASSGAGWLTDVRDAVRGLRAGRSTTALALLILTLGIAAGTVTFSVVDALAIRELPYRDPTRLIAIARVSPHSTGYGSLAPQDFFALEQGVAGFDGIAAAGRSSLPGDTPDSPPVIGARTTTNFFDVLGVSPLLGRGFTANEDTAGRDAVIVLSHPFWVQHFGSDPQVVGRQVRFGSQTREVIGVMPAEFAFWLYQGKAANFWVPYVPSADDRNEASPGRGYIFQVFARVRPSVSSDQARSQVDTVWARMRKPSFDRGSSFVTLPLQDLVVGPAKSWLLLMLAAVALVLLASCVNVANLLLARATRRRRELATREALGASRARLGRTLLLEGLLLALVAAGAGIVLSYWGIGVARSVLPDALARVKDISLDGRVLFVSASAAGLCGLIFGAAPALQISRSDLNGAIKNDAGAVIGGSGRGRWLGVLLIIEVAFVATLLVGTGLVVATFIHVMTMDLGFDRHDVVTFAVSKPLKDVPKDERAAVAEAFVNGLIDRVRTVPGVTAASVVQDGVPMSGLSALYSIKLPNGVATGDDLLFHPVTSDYFATMGIALVRGRLIDRSDRSDAPLVAVINDIAAQRFFPNVDPVGQVVTFRGPTTIVGVVASARTQGPEHAAQPELYTSLSQELHANAVSYGDLAVRVAHLTPDLTARIGAAIAPALGNEKPPEPKPIEDLFRKVTAQRRFSAGVLFVFGAVAALIAAIGIYGVIAFLVAQQAREIGLRMALGASSRGVLVGVLGRAARYVAIGLVLGLGGARAISRLFTSLVFGVTATDMRVYTGVGAFLLVIGVVAALAPAWRASRVDPLTALRAE
jgi:putative ABC transport system permease protein